MLDNLECQGSKVEADHDALVRMQWDEDYPGRWSVLRAFLSLCSLPPSRQLVDSQVSLVSALHDYLTTKVAQV